MRGSKRSTVLVQSGSDHFRVCLSLVTCYIQFYLDSGQVISGFRVAFGLCIANYKENCISFLLISFSIARETSPTSPLFIQLKTPREISKIPLLESKNDFGCWTLSQARKIVKERRDIVQYPKILNVFK